MYLFLYTLGFIIHQKTTHPVLKHLSKPVTIAHQGGNKVYPDESLLAFTNAEKDTASVFTEWQQDKASFSTT
ncbi:MAG TPA: hypothetical protein EYO96_01945, partial [Candidatus Marinimicrobia bacterium]|nr:hypothetical protein [Candidatus Neomarinimicrobiota bacterium]